MTAKDDLHESWIELKQAARDLLPPMIDLFAAMWNLSMRALMAMRVMPYLVKMPFLLVALLVLLVVLCPPLILLIAPMAAVALHKKVKAAQNFMILAPETVVVLGEDDIEIID